MATTSLEAAQLLPLASPAVTILLGLAFLYLWLFQTRASHVLMIAATFFIYAAGTIWQLLPPSWPGAGLYGIASFYLYLLAAVLLAESMLRHAQRTLPYVWVAIFSLLIIVALNYFHYVSDLPLVRVQILSLSCGLLLISTLPRLSSLRNSTHANRMLFWIYAVFNASCFLCGAIVTFEIVNVSIYDLKELWLLLQLTLLVFIGMLAIALLLAITSDEIDSLRRERDIDPLTSLLNRRGFYNTAAAILSQHTGQPTCVLICDIDYFKRINDRYGHAIGDKVLQKLGTVLRDTIRATDIAGRIGGEEFAILMPGARLASASRLAERLRLAVMQAQYPDIPESQAITGSFGIVLLQDNESLHEALQRADSLMYKAKESGRNQIVNAKAIIARGPAPITPD